MNFNLSASVEILERTPSTIKALFYDANHDWHLINEGENTWSSFNIIGHLIHGEKTDWIPRAKIILSDSSNKTFEPYDRWAQDKLYSTQSMNWLLDEFERLRQENLKQLVSWDLLDADLEKQGNHPDLGTVTLRQLLATWTIHDLSHINQMTRVMVKHYKEEVGSWKEYNRLLR